MDDDDLRRAGPRSAQSRTGQTLERASLYGVPRRKLRRDGAPRLRPGEVIGHLKKCERDHPEGLGPTRAELDVWGFASQPGWNPEWLASMIYSGDVDSRDGRLYAADKFWPTAAWGLILIAAGAAGVHFLAMAGAGQ